MDYKSIQLLGRVFLKGDIISKTGLHIGGAAGNLEIGGVDSPVLRDPLTNRPYIPGSSLRGKMRSLSERLFGKAQNFAINRTRGNEVYIHTCQAGKAPEGTDAEYESWKTRYQEEFRQCQVCSIFGVTGDEPVPHPTALIVRDTHLSNESAQQLEEARTDLPFTEVKWEATIDRVTSAATPRQIERVPAGSVFEGFELVYSVYDSAGSGHFEHLLTALTLLEEDYLGGLGARGGGKVELQVTDVYVRKGTSYEQVNMGTLPSAQLHAGRGAILDFVRTHFENA